MGLHAGNRNRPAYSGQARYHFPQEVIDLFRPRPPLEYVPPPPRRRLRRMTGLADLVHRFESRAEVLARPSPAPSFKPPALRRTQATVGAAARVTAAVARKARDFDPFAESAAKTREAFNTLFVARLPRSTTTAELRTEFAKYGVVLNVTLPRCRKGLPRGYGFVEYLHERDLRIAFREVKGRVLFGRKIVVDVERGRTVKGWLPNRLDGPNNSAARASRKILAGRNSVAAEAREMLRKVEPPVVIEREKTPEKAVPTEVLRFEEPPPRPGHHGHGGLGTGGFGGLGGGGGGVSRPGWERGPPRDRFGGGRDSRDRRGERPRGFAGGGDERPRGFGSSGRDRRRSGGW